MGAPRLSIDDKQQIERLTRQGLSASAIAHTVGCSKRSVERWQAHTGIRSTWGPVRALAVAWAEGYAAGQDSLSGPTGEYVDDPRLKNPYTEPTDL